MLVRWAIVSVSHHTDVLSHDEPVVRFSPGKPFANHGFYVPRMLGEFVDIGDGSLFVREAGFKDDPFSEPAVFVHGLGGSSTNWTELMYLLQDTLYSIAPDLPGFGQSPPLPSDDYTLQAHADAVARLIEKRFGDVPVHVFGNSMGGAISVQLAARHPQLVRTMTLISPALPELVPRRSSIHMPIGAIPGLGEKLMERMLTRDAEWRVKTSMEICYSDTRRIDARRFAEQVEEARYRDSLPHSAKAGIDSLRGIIRSYFDSSPQRPWNLARKIAVPVLMIYGRDDQLVNPKAAFKATKRFPNSRVMVVPYSGHVTQMEYPGLAARAFRELIKEN